MLNELQFGLTIPQGWRGGDLPLEEENNAVKQYEFSKNIVKTADNLGFDSLYAYDHFIPHYKDDIGKNIFECFALLSAVAAITEKSKIGQVVACNSYRNPALLAKVLSTLDVISNGRAELGIGAGWYENEYSAYGYVYPSDKTRVKQLDEALTIIKAMWIEKTSATFAGKYYRIKDAICNPKPVQKPHPIIMVGGSGENYLLRVAARHANRYNLYFALPDEMKRKISILKDHCYSIGRDNKEIQNSVVLPCIIRETDKEVNEEIIRYKRKDKTIEQFVQYLAGGHAIGTPEKILEGINKYVSIGVTHFILHFMAINEKTLRLFESKIIRKI
jgi:F420-dependent oxidoreductase-like protein